MSMKVSTNAGAQGATVQLGGDDGKRSCAVTMSVSELDAAIAELVAARARLKPCHPATLDPHEAPALACDNLLWDVKSQPSGRGLVLGLHHAGLGWLTADLSRAQVEDLITSLQFEAAVLDRTRTDARQEQEGDPTEARQRLRVGL